MVSSSVFKTINVALVKDFIQVHLGAIVSGSGLDSVLGIATWHTMRTVGKDGVHFVLDLQWLLKDFVRRVVPNLGHIEQVTSDWNTFVRKLTKCTVLLQRN